MASYRGIDWNKGNLFVGSHFDVGLGENTAKRRLLTSWLKKTPYKGLAPAVRFAVGSEDIPSQLQRLMGQLPFSSGSYEDAHAFVNPSPAVEDPGAAAVDVIVDPNAPLGKTHPGLKVSEPPKASAPPMEEDEEYDAAFVEGLKQSGLIPTEVKRPGLQQQTTGQEKPQEAPKLDPLPPSAKEAAKEKETAKEKPKEAAPVPAPPEEKSKESSPQPAPPEEKKEAPQEKERKPMTDEEILARAVPKEVNKEWELTSDGQTYRRHLLDFLEEAKLSNTGDVVAYNAFNSHDSVKEFAKYVKALYESAFKDETITASTVKGVLWDNFKKTGKHEIPTRAELKQARDKSVARSKRAKEKAKEKEETDDLS